MALNSLFCADVPLSNSLTHPSLDVESFKNFENFKTLRRKWQKLRQPFDVAQTYELM